MAWIPFNLSALCHLWHLWRSMVFLTQVSIMMATWFNGEGGRIWRSWCPRKPYWNILKREWMATIRTKIVITIYLFTYVYIYIIIHYNYIPLKTRHELKNVGLICVDGFVRSSRLGPSISSWYTLNIHMHSYVYIIRYIFIITYIYAWYYIYTYIHICIV